MVVLASIGIIMVGVGMAYGCKYQVQIVMFMGKVEKIKNYQQNISLIKMAHDKYSGCVMLKKS